MQKYTFKHHIFDLEGATDEEVIDLWKRYKDSPGEVAHACLERFYDPAETAHFDWHERLQLTTHNHNWARVRPMKHKQIAELAAIAGVKFWEMNDKVLCHDQMQALYAWVKTNEQRLKDTWNLGDHKWVKRGGEFHATKNPEHLKLQRLLERWGGDTR